MHPPTNEAPPAYDLLPPPSPSQAPPELDEKARLEERDREEQENVPEYDSKDEKKGRERGKEKQEVEGPVASMSKLRDLSVFSGGEPLELESKTAAGTARDVIVVVVLSVKDPESRKIHYTLLYPDVSFYGNWTHATLHESHYPPGPEIGRINKVYGSSSKKWVRIRGHPETLLEQQGVFGLKTSSSHAFKGPGGADYLWRKQSSSTSLDWELIKKLPNKAEHVVSQWKIYRRCDGGDGRYCRILINKEFESSKELILATGLAVIQWAITSDSGTKTALNDYLS